MARTKVYAYLSAVLSGLMLWLSWPPLQLPFLSFIALIPLLYAVDQMMVSGRVPALRIVLASYLAFFVWNILTTWWVAYASIGGAAMAIILNSLLMTFPIFFYYRVRRGSRRWVSYAALVSFWLSFEYMHLNWDAPWPWLNIGNLWASSVHWVQWYEYTGTMGGTLWVWAVNILLYESIMRFDEPQSAEKGRLARLASPVSAVILLVVPLFISTSIEQNWHEGGSSYRQRTLQSNVVAVQPNIDPYNEKFDPGTFTGQIQTLIKLSEQAIDSHTVLVTWPETAIAEDLNEGELLVYGSVQQVHAFLLRHPKIRLISGSSSYSVYGPEDKPSPTARLFRDNSAYFDVFNSAMLLDTGPTIQVYHKSKLVPGVEKIPYPRIFGIFEKLAINLGGASGSLGSQDSPSVFHISKEVAAAPVICYESIFGEYVSRYVREGANLITIITNDGWWQNTPGHVQHMEYAALRAIETRKFISRAANTGTSCFILPTGEIIQQTEWWKPAVIRHDIILTDELTFYTRHGDFLARIALVVATGFFIWAFVHRLRHFIKRRQVA